ncbi:MAG: tetratricopeptide repeat protein [Nitrospirae bacterium]|nr:tetratricopeptide repeat protein [Nitrospirota bacterium]
MIKGTQKRTFPRKKLNLDFDLVLTGEYVPAIITDFSLYGVGILIKGRSDLSSQVLDLRIHDIDLNTTGKIVWKREMFSGLKVGVLCSGPVAGRFRSYCFADLAVGIYRSRKTGVLTVGTGQWSRKIFFKDGEMVYATSDIEDEQLGRMLLSSGRISLHQYQNSLALARQTGKSQGTVLVEMRYLSPPELIKAVHQRVENVIMNLCGIEDAQFSFREEALPRNEIVIMRLNSAGLLYQGSKRSERLDRVRNKLLTPGALLGPSIGKGDMLSRLSLNEHDSQILSLVQKNTTLAEVLTRSPLAREETMMIMQALINTHLVDFEEEILPRDDEAQKHGEPEAPHARRPMEQDAIDKIDKLYHEHMKLGYHGVLGLNEQITTSTELKRAYHDMAKEYHPDRYQHGSDALKEKLNVIFAYINEAYRQLSKSSTAGSVHAGARRHQEPSEDQKNRNLASDKYREGREHLAAGNLEEAATFLGQAVYIDETVPDYHFFYGVALFRNKKIKDAETSIRKALQLSPHNAGYITELGYIYLKLGFKTRARHAFEKALTFDPSNPRATEGLSLTEEVKS